MRNCGLAVRSSLRAAKPAKLNRASWNDRFARFDCLGKHPQESELEKGQMRVGTFRLQRRTVKGLYYAAGSFTLLVVGAAFFLLMGMLLMPEAKEVPWR